MYYAVLTSPGPRSPSGHPRVLKSEPEASGEMVTLPGNVPVISKEEVSPPTQG